MFNNREVFLQCFLFKQERCFHNPFTPKNRRLFCDIWQVVGCVLTVTLSAVMPSSHQAALSVLEVCWLLML